MNRASRSGSCDEFRGKNLQRDFTIQSRVVRVVDLAHAAGTERADDSIHTEKRTSDQTSGRPNMSAATRPGKSSATADDGSC